ncbi:MAG: bifunctional biotin--[acetyl-CoA-carboxylase] ligase/biotin operon repressor BirA [Pseudomonadota bacterium]
MLLRGQLLNRLADGEYHSGAALGAALGVSRMAVWKHLSALRELGIELETVRGRGYRLRNACELLDADSILSHVGMGARPLLGPLEVLLETDSTNSRLRQRALDGASSGTICLAEMQHGGRGRRGRRWVSPFASNLYLSLLWRTPLGAAALGGLSLVAGIAVLRCLRAFGVTAAGLKWPNDVIAGAAKLAGILIDVAGEAAGPCAVVVGVGINVAMPPTAARDIDQTWTDLRTVTGTGDISRNRLAAGLLDELLPALQAFETDGLQPFMTDWQRYDLVGGRPVNVHLHDTVVQGLARGIDAGGALLVDTDSGRRRFTSGEVSVRVTA